MSGADLSGKVALVTGAASGIGRATAILLARRGARVVVADIADDAGAETVAAIEGANGVAACLHVDVTDFDACKRLVAFAVDRFGQLDIAFNNAGIVDRPPAKTGDMTRAAWDRAIAVNLTGIFNCMHHEIRAMRDRGGSIVNTSSIMGLQGRAGGAAYCASKHGVIGLTKAAALEYGRRGIRINAVCPGYIATPMTIGGNAVFSESHREAMIAETSLGRLGDPNEVAAMVVWLCSDEAAYVTGTAMLVDGGVGAA